MSYLTQEELDKRLGSSTNLVTLAKKPIVDFSPIDIPADAEAVEKPYAKNPEVVTPYFIQNGKKKTLTPLGREMVGVAATTSSVDVAAAAFGISTRTVNRTLRGEDGNGTLVPGLKDKIEEGIERVREKTLNRMVVALDNMTDEKLENRDAKELSVITSNLSRVIAATNPQQKGPSAAAAVIFVTPEQKTLDQYETAEV